ncbi:MAG TPA: SH3 domain-containing protein, partial [Gemmatimonadaceae bacterium]
QDADNPEWWWCRADDGRAGWVPAVLLDPSPSPSARARLRTPYSARELSVRINEELVVEQVHAGWLLVSNRGGERGWVPVTHVEH